MSRGPAMHITYTLLSQIVLRLRLKYYYIPKPGIYQPDSIERRAIFLLFPTSRSPQLTVVDTKMITVASVFFPVTSIISVGDVAACFSLVHAI